MQQTNQVEAKTYMISIGINETHPATKGNALATLHDIHRLLSKTLAVDSSDAFLTTWREEVDEIFFKLKGRVMPHDRVVIYLNAHGSSDGFVVLKSRNPDPKLNSHEDKKSYLYGTELKKLMDESIPPQTETALIVESCFGACTAKACAAPNRLVISSAGEDETALRRTDKNIGVFSHRFIEALVTTKQQKLFASIDSTGNGKVSFREAFAYAKKMVARDISASKNKAVHRIRYLYSFLPNIDFEHPCNHPVILSGDGIDFE